MLEQRVLTLIAPKIAPALAQAAGEDAARWPELAKLAGRGSVRALELSARDMSRWQLTLLERLGLGSEAARYPVAAVVRSGDEGRRAQGFWMQATPMHWLAGLDRLDAVRLEGESAVERSEREHLFEPIAGHLSSAGLELVQASSGDWLIRSERAWQVQTSSPETASAGPLEDAMPRGADASRLRRLMTELQMILHEHPVNTSRARRGLPEINAIWLHGVGSLSELPERALPDAFGDELYLRGLYAVHGGEVQALPGDAAGLLAAMRKETIAVLDTEHLDELERHWLAPLRRALGRGALAQVDFVLGRWLVQVRRSALLKFWRKGRAPAEWASC
ncbi:MAG TPA: hypothetical protein VF193_14000 [Steroidobacter sp.]